MTEGRPPAPLVLIAPAMAVGSHYYRPLVEAFETIGWQARALPRRGFERGLPRASRRHDWTYRDEIDDLAEAVRQARSENPQRPLLLLGHSLGAQLIAGYQMPGNDVEGVVVIGGSVPHFRHYRYGGLPLLLMAGAIVPVATRWWGYVPGPAFGSPGARTLMLEWARMVRTGRPPYRVAGPIATPSLIVMLEGDDFSPPDAVDALAALYHPDLQERWDYRDAAVPIGGSNDHITWVRSPGPVVEQVRGWWAEVEQGAGGRRESAEGRQ